MADTFCPDEVTHAALGLEIERRILIAPSRQLIAAPQNSKCAVIVSRLRGRPKVEQGARASRARVGQPLFKYTARAVMVESATACCAWIQATLIRVLRSDGVAKQPAGFRPGKRDKSAWGSAPLLLRKRPSGPTTLARRARPATAVVMGGVREQTNRARARHAGIFYDVLVLF